MSPPPCSFMTGTTAFMTRKVPVEFTSMIFRHSSAVVSSSERFRTLMPELMTATSSRPCASVIVFATVPMSLSRVTSA